MLKIEFFFKFHQWKVSTNLVLGINLALSSLFFVGKVAYRLALSQELSRVHNVFHILQLRKFVGDPSKIVQIDQVELNENLQYKIYLIHIIDTKIRVMHNREVPLVKVLLSRYDIE